MATPLTNADVERLFNQNFAAIKATRDAGSNKSWERAFRSVTGVDWPKGQDVKINPDGRSGYISKDPEVLKKVVTYGSIAAAAIAAPYAIGALAGGGAAAAPAALQGGSTLAANLGGASALPAAFGGTAATVGGTGAAVGGAGAVTRLAGPPPVTPPPPPPGGTASRNWLGPLFGGGISTIGQLVAGHQANTAATDAAKIQADAAQKALDFERQSYGDIVGRLSPYMNSGASATDRMNNVLGLDASNYTAGIRNGAPVSSAAMPPQSAGQTITLRSPSGSVKTVPLAEKDHWLRLGAQVVT